MKGFYNSIKKISLLFLVTMGLNYNFGMESLDRNNHFNTKSLCDDITKSSHNIENLLIMELEQNSLYLPKNNIELITDLYAEFVQSKEFYSFFNNSYYNYKYLDLKLSLKSGFDQSLKKLNKYSSFSLKEQDQIFNYIFFCMIVEAYKIGLYNGQWLLEIYEKVKLLITEKPKLD